MTAKRAQGVRASTLVSCASAMRTLDRLTGAMPYRTVTAAVLEHALEVHSGTHERSSTRCLANTLRNFYKWANDGECPNDIKRALFRQPVPLVKHVAPISQNEFVKLLEAAEREDVTESPARQARRRALLWLLWDSGFRISEVLALRVSSFAPDEQGGARITIPNDAPDLKTGARTIYVVDCVGALRLWLSLHPFRRNPNAALFPRWEDAHEPMAVGAVNRILEGLTRRSGVRAVHPHLFRHTRATRAAEAGWNESEMRSYFGWARGSAMASHYVHLAQAHMEERVRKDAQLDPLGARIRQDPHAALAETVAATIVALDRTGRLSPGRSRSPRQDDGDAAASAGYP